MALKRLEKFKRTGEAALAYGNDQERQLGDIIVRLCETLEYFSDPEMYRPWKVGDIKMEIPVLVNGRTIAELCQGRPSRPTETQREET